jgi:hypothetical protein
MRRLIRALRILWAHVKIYFIKKIWLYRVYKDKYWDSRLPIEKLTILTILFYFILSFKLIIGL